MTLISQQLLAQHRTRIAFDLEHQTHGIVAAVETSYFPFVVSVAVWLLAVPQIGNCFPSGTVAAAVAVAAISCQRTLTYSSCCFGIPVFVLPWGVSELLALGVGLALAPWQ